MINGELIVDNFAGGGGASTGIEMATGYSVDIAINHDPEAIRMHKANHPNARHYCENVWDVDPVKACNGHTVGLAWFSPDCKHFSKAKGGKPVEKKIRGLAWIVLKWAALVRPKVIMLENVEEFQTWGPCIPKRDKETGRVLVMLPDGKTRVAEPGEVVGVGLQVFEPDPRRKGQTYKRWRRQLEGLGYKIETKELIAADYGAPTMRKRFFMIARCDGKTIVWPEPTHGPADSERVKAGLIKPYVGAYTQIDFSRPCPSIFDTAEEIKQKYGIRAVRPLAPKTMERIARGLKKYVLENPQPFIIQCNHGGERRPQDIRQPMPTITGRHGFGIVEPYMVQIGQTGFTADRSKDVRDPLTTIVGKNEHCLIEPKLAPIIDKTYGGNYQGAGSKVDDPIDTITTVDHNRLVEATLAPCIMCNNENNVGANVENPLPTITTGNRNFLVAPTLIQYHSETATGEVRGQTIEDPIMTVDGSNRYGLVTSFLSKFYKSGIGQDIRDPLHTITTSPGHFGEVRAFLVKYYGDATGQDIKAPLDTVTTKDRFGLVTIEGVGYQIVDIGLRMLEPRELYGCQGFPDDYIIDRDYTGRTYPKSEQVKRCGNAVCPPIPAALVKANLPELCKAERTPNMKIEVGETGQMRFS